MKSRRWSDPGAVFTPVRLMESALAPSGGKSVPQAAKDRRCFRRGVIAVGVILHWALVAGAPAQQPVRVIRPQQPQQQPQAAVLQRMAARNPRTDQAPMLIETSAPIANLLSRAEEGMQRGDWKFVIDSLQRILEDEEGSLIACEGGAAPSGARFESARRLVQRKLLELPEEGIAAYRLLYDGTAKALLERARANHDAALLETIVERYLATSHGPSAAGLLASWLIDSGAASEALSVLLDALQAIPPESPMGQTLVRRMAVAQVLSGSAEVADLPEEWSHGVEELRTRFAGSSLASPSQGWSFDDSQRAMPLVVPRVDRTLWRHELSGRTAQLWRRIYKDDPRDPLVLPAQQLAFEGDRLFTRTKSGCIALDARDLTLLWHVEAELPWGVNSTNRSGGDVLSEDEDFLAAAISAGQGLVFTVEPVHLSAAERAETVPFGQQRRVLPPTSRLVAYDARTGAMRWSRSGFVGQEDDLFEAYFRSAPILIQGRLWIPYTRQGDLYIAILSATDGTTYRNRLLGSLSAPVALSSQPILLTHSNGIVYVPTGQGAVFALSAHDGATRWAAQYARQIRSYRAEAGMPELDGSPSAPVVSGGAIILAPSDTSELLALSIRDGSYLWSSKRDAGSYIIAAGEGRLWLGGRSLRCLSTLDGTQLWSTEVVAVPTGRAVLCGDRIHVPLSSGLESIDAQTGAIIGEQSLAAMEAPLGNLYCKGPSLYSVDPASIRRYIDVDQAYALASAQSRQGDVGRAVELAWVELVRGRPDAARQAIVGLSLSPQDDERRRKELATVRLHIARAIAEDPQTPLAESMRELQALREMPLAEKDQLDVAFRLADLMQKSGALEDSRNALLDIGLGPLAAISLPISETVEAPARFLAAQRLRELRTTLDLESEPAHLADLVAKLASEIQERKLTAEELRLLSGLVELDVSSSLTIRALRILARHCLQAKQYERSEYHLLQAAARDSDDPSDALMAWLELAALYGPAHQNDGDSLAWALLEIERQFGDQSMPLADNANAKSDGSPMLVREWVEQQRARLPSASRDAAMYLAMDTREKTARNVALTEDLAWTYGGSLEQNPSPRATSRVQEELPSFRMVLFPGRGSATVQRLLGFASTQRLECLDPVTGQVLWRTDLRVPEDFDLRRGEESKGPRFALAAGQIGMFNTGEGIFAVGLITGRLLWARAYDVPYDSNTYIYGDRAMAVHGGTLAAIIRDGQLGLYRVHDGSVIWERDLRGEPVHSLSMDDARVITFDVANQRVHIFDRRSGNLVRQVLLKQPDPLREVVPILHADGKLFAPHVSSSGDAVVVIGLADGKELLRIATGKPIAALFQPRAGYVGVGLLGGDLRILNAENGEIVLEKTFTGVRTVVDARLVAGTLTALLSIQKGDRKAYDAVGVDVATGEELWRRSDVMAMASNAALELVGDLLPVLGEVSKTEVSPQGVAQPRLKSLLALVDVRTGATAGAMLDLSSSSIRPTGEVAMYPGVLVVGNTKGLWAYKLAPVPAGNGRL